MLSIGPGQLDAMVGPHRAEVDRRLTFMLRDVFPEEIGPLDYDEAVALVRERIADALALGLTQQKHLFLHASLGPLLGWSYAEDPDCAWIDQMLADSDLGPPADRLAIVMELLRGE